jgi:hypothetical protein
MQILINASAWIDRQVFEWFVGQINVASQGDDNPSSNRGHISQFILFYSREANDHQLPPVFSEGGSFVFAARQ